MKRRKIPARRISSLLEDCIASCPELIKTIELSRPLSIDDISRYEISSSDYFPRIISEVRSLCRLAQCNRNLKHLMYPSIRKYIIYPLSMIKQNQINQYTQIPINISIDEKNFQLSSLHGLSFNIREIDLSNTFNESLKCEDFNGSSLRNLKKLTFGCKYDKILLPGVLPTTLTDLHFKYYFNQLLLPGCLPNSLMRLWLSTCYNQKLDHGVLPESLTILGFGSSFNQPLLPGVLPDRLTLLAFCGNFNQPLENGVLPQGLLTLDFGEDFNQPLHPNVLPKSLKILRFGKKFNQILYPGVLPESLITLVLNKDFDKSKISTILPTSLKCVRYENN